MPLRSLVLIALLLLVVGCGPAPRTPEAPATPAPAGGERGSVIEAAPNPVPTGGGQGTTTITWSTAGSETGQVFVSEDGAPEALFGEGRDGAQVAPWIKPGMSYTFTLYAGTERARRLATVTVTGQ